MRRIRGWVLGPAAACMLAACGTPAPKGDEAATDRPSAAAAGNAAGPPALVPRAAAIPPAFHGDYDESREACGRPSQYRLTVSAGELHFHESLGSIREVVVESPDSIRVTADYQGEGESWRAAHRLRLSESGARLTVDGEGVSFTRSRCRPGAAG
jgi:hypothetical protein